MPVKLLSYLIVISIVVLHIDGGFSQEHDPALARWREFARKPEAGMLLAWLRCHANAKLSGNRCDDALRIDLPPYFGMLGIFITLIKGKKVRGCYGAFSHGSADIRSLLLDYLSGALTGDPRYKPLNADELEKTDIVITITGQPYTVDGLDSVDTLRCGFSIACDGRAAAVFVPAEVRDVLYVQKLVTGKVCQIQVFRAVTVR